MKIIGIGDIHGRDDWKDIIENVEFDKIVFIGDYFDTFEEIPGTAQIRNFNNILQYKRENTDKVVLLFGNHDFHYMRGIDTRYSGYQPAHANVIQEAIHQGLDDDLMQMCFIYDQYMFTHAGVTNTWLKNVGYNNENLEGFINDLFKYKPGLFGFTPGRNLSNTGNDITQTPIWVRPASMLNDMVKGYTHVVGHTVQSKLRIHPDITIIDTLPTSGEFLAIEDGDMSVSKLNKGEEPV